MSAVTVCSVLVQCVRVMYVCRECVLCVLSSDSVLSTGTTRIYMSVGKLTIAASYWAT